MKRDISFSSYKLILHPHSGLVVLILCLFDLNGSAQVQNEITPFSNYIGISLFTPYFPEDPEPYLMMERLTEYFEFDNSDTQTIYQTGLAVEYWRNVKGFRLGVGIGKFKRWLHRSSVYVGYANDEETLLSRLHYNSVTFNHDGWSASFHFGREWRFNKMSISPAIVISALLPQGGSTFGREDDWDFYPLESTVNYNTLDNWSFKEKSLLIGPGIDLRLMYDVGNRVQIGGAFSGGLLWSFIQINKKYTYTDFSLTPENLLIDGSVYNDSEDYYYNHSHFSMTPASFKLLAGVCF